MPALASSNLASYTYNENTRTLWVTFKSGRTYSYRAVPQDVVDGLAQAASAGKYFNHNIRDTYDEGPAAGSIATEAGEEHA